MFLAMQQTIDASAGSQDPRNTSAQQVAIESATGSHNNQERLYRGLRQARVVGRFGFIRRIMRRILTEVQVQGFDQGPRSTFTADIRGGKGNGLSELSRLGMPVPPGATVFTSIARRYALTGKLPSSLAYELSNALDYIERKTGLTFGGKEKPLLISVRSGAPISMPGMMDTILNVGLNRKTINGLAARAGERFAWDSYRRFLAMFGTTVMGVDRILFESILTQARNNAGVTNDTELSVDSLQQIAADFEQAIETATGRSIPTDPLEQLALSVVAVLDSWTCERAVAYRQKECIDETLGTAVNIQAMVFGNKGLTSGTGVVFSSNPLTGEDGLYGEYLSNAQGEDVVSGVRTPEPVASLGKTMPQVFADLVAKVEQLALHYRDMVDVEFTVEDGQLYLLQVRSAKRSLQASMMFAVNQVEKGLWVEEDAIASVGVLEDLRAGERTLVLQDDTTGDTCGPVLDGLAASPGVARGRIYFSLAGAIEAADRGEKVILMRMDTFPDDLPAMLKSQAIITACGGSTSHAAVVARGLNIPAVVGCEFFIDGDRLLDKNEQLVFVEGDLASVDGKTGKIYAGELPIQEGQNNEVIEKILGYYKRTELVLLTKGIDVSYAETQWNMNKFLNDFYILNSMLAASESAGQYGLAKKIRKVLGDTEYLLAEVLTCYLTIAVYSEIRYLSATARITDSSARELMGMGELAEHSRDQDVVATRKLSERDHSYQEYFFFLCSQAFVHKSWSSGFGGKPWAQIAAAPGEFLAGRLPASVYIDHVFDLRHNGGVLFNKHSMTSHRTSESVLRDQLDIKKKVSRPDELFRKLIRISPHVDDDVVALFEEGAATGLWSSLDQPYNGN